MRQQYFMICRPFVLGPAGDFRPSVQPSIFHPSFPYPINIPQGVQAPWGRFVQMTVQQIGICLAVYILKYKIITINHTNCFYPQLVFEVILLLLPKVIIDRRTWWGYLAYLHTSKGAFRFCHKISAISRHLFLMTFGFPMCIPYNPTNIPLFPYIYSLYKSLLLL